MHRCLGPYILHNICVHTRTYTLWYDTSQIVCEDDLRRMQAAFLTRLFQPFQVLQFFACFILCELANVCSFFLLLLGLIYQLINTRRAEQNISVCCVDFSHRHVFREKSTVATQCTKTLIKSAGCNSSGTALSHCHCVVLATKPF